MLPGERGWEIISMGGTNPSAPQQEKDYFPLRVEHPLCLQQTENKIWIFEIFSFYLANKVDHTSLKCMKKKKNSLPFLQELAEGGLWFPVLHLLLSISLQHPLRTENGASFISCISFIIKSANIWVGKDCRARSNLSQTLYTQIPTLRTAWVPHPPHFSTYSSFPDWLWPRCSLHIQLSVITLQKPLSWAFPTPLCHSVFTLPTVPTNPTGMLGWDCWVLCKNAASPENNSLPPWTKDCQGFFIPLPKSSFNLNCCFLLQPEGPWDYKTFKSFFFMPSHQDFIILEVKLFCIKRLNFWCWSFCFELQNSKNVISKLTCEHLVKAWMK